MEVVETIMDVADNFNEGELDLNIYGCDYPGRVSAAGGTGKDRRAPKKCVRKGEVVCYIKDENINMMPNVNQRISTPNHSFVTNSKTYTTTETDMYSGESLYKTFIFEESLNDSDTHKCISFWKSVMEKNLAPIKCTIIENKKNREKDVKVESEKAPSRIENNEDKVKEATDKVHAEYKAMWKAALKEIQDKKLDKVKLIGKARCKLCETIESPMEEYSTDVDQNVIKDEVKGLNEWVSVSTKLSKTRRSTRKESKKYKEKDKHQYKFVNVVEEKKRLGVYKQWRSNTVKPPCSCGKVNCECNINPAITSVRASPCSPVPKLLSAIPTAKTETVLGGGKAPRPAYQEKPVHPEKKPKPVPLEYSSEKEYKETGTQHQFPAVPIKPPAEYKKADEKRSFPYTEEKTSSHRANTDDTREDDNVPSVIKLLSENFADDISHILVTKATPFIKHLCDTIVKEMSELSAISNLPYAQESTFLKEASGTVVNDISQMIMDKTIPTLKNVSESLLAEISGIIVNKAVPFINKLSVVGEEQGASYESLVLPDESGAMQVRDSNRLLSALKKPKDESVVYYDSDESKGSISVTPAVSIMLPTGEIELTHDRSEQVNMDLTWEKPKIIAPKIPAGSRRGSVEMMKAKKEFGKSTPPPSPRTSDVDDVYNFDVNMDLFQNKGGDFSTTSVPIDSLAVFTSKESMLVQKERLEKLKNWKRTSEAEQEIGPIQVVEKRESYEKHVPLTPITGALVGGEHVIPKDSIFVHKDNLTKHKTTDEEILEVRAGATRVYVVPEVVASKLNLEKFQTATKESVAEMNKRSLEKTFQHYINLKPLQEESQEFRTAPETVINVETLNPTVMKDSVYIHKEHVDKHKKEVESTENLESLTTKVHITPKANYGIPNKEPIRPAEVKDSISVYKDHEKKRLSTIPKPSGSFVKIPGKVHVTSEAAVPGTKLNLTDTKDSVALQKDKLKKSKSEPENENELSLDVIPGKVRVSPEARYAIINTENNIPTEIKDSVFIHKENLQKKKESEVQTTSDHQWESDILKIQPKLETVLADIDMESQNSLSIKNHSHKRRDSEEKSYKGSEKDSMKRRVLPERKEHLNRKSSKELDCETMKVPSKSETFVKSSELIKEKESAQQRPFTSEPLEVYNINLESLNPIKDRKEQLERRENEGTVINLEALNYFEQKNSVDVMKKGMEEAASRTGTNAEFSVNLSLIRNKKVDSYKKEREKYDRGPPPSDVLVETDIPEKVKIPKQEVPQ